MNAITSVGAIATITVTLAMTACLSDQQKQNVDDCCTCLASTDAAGAAGSCLEPGQDQDKCTQSMTAGYTLGASSVDTELTASSCVKVVCLSSCQELINEGFRFKAPKDSAGTMSATLEGTAFEATFTTATNVAGADTGTSGVTVTGTDAGGAAITLTLGAVDGPNTYPVADFSNFEIQTPNGDAKSGTVTVTAIDDATFTAEFTGNLESDLTRPARTVEGTVDVRFGVHGQDGDIDLSAFGAPADTD